MAAETVRLWSDEPSPVDLLAFDAVAETAVEAALDDALDPVALGISGPWGSGKSTVLRLIEAELESRSTEDDAVLVVSTDPWRYDPSVGAKATLINEVLATLANELNDRGDVTEAAENALRKLAKRVNWVKALKVAAKASITLQLPKIDDLSQLIIEEPNDNGEGEVKTLDDFRSEFASLLAEGALTHVRRIVVLVDDLDRCLPETVVETLETMRLFLSVPKMSFVIAADEDRVADALRERYPKHESANGEAGEEPARLYLHKIVQTTLTLPALSRFDTEAFLLLLLLQNRAEAPIDSDKFQSILASCTNLRITAGTLDALELPDGVDIRTELQFAARLTPMLYEKLRGSPRRVKRFLNDLNVRASIANRRGIVLDIAVVAKLMILELLLADEFQEVLAWLASGTLREHLTGLERLAGRISTKGTTNSEPKDAENDTQDEPREESEATDIEQPDRSPDQPFSENFVRWAKLPPPLADTDLSPYLHLAASFAGTAMIDPGLPERLRDIAAHLLSSSRAEQKAVTDLDLKALKDNDAGTLIEHLGRMARDRPKEMRAAVAGILRITNLQPDAVKPATEALKKLPFPDIRPPTVLQFDSKAADMFDGVLEQWAKGSEDQSVKNAINQVRKGVNR